MRATHSRSWRTFILFFICLWLCSTPGISAAETAIFTLQFREASEAQSIVQNLLSPEGKISIDSRTNSLVITDRKENIAKISEFLIQFDTQMEQVKVRLRFHEAGSSNSKSVSVQGGASGKNWKVFTGSQDKDGVQVGVQDQEQRQTGSTEMFLQTGSGQWAYLVIGRDILYTEKWVVITRRFARVSEDVFIKKIETGFDVKPVLVGDHVLIDIVPRISHARLEKGRDVIYFAEASVRLRVPLGQWVEIAGINQSSNEVFNTILSQGNAETSGSFSISIWVEKF